MQVHGRVVLLGLAQLSGLFASKGLDALVSLVVVLDEELFVLGVHPLESVRSVSVHVSETIGGATVRHQNGHLVESLRRVAPEVPRHVRVLDSRLWVPLLAVDEVGELYGVLDEKHGRIVTDHVVVAFLGVMLESEATRVTVAVVGTAFTGNGGEAEEDGSPLADSVHESGLSEAIGKK